MKKKLLALGLVAAMAVSMAACGGKDDSAAKSESKAESTTTESSSEETVEASSASTAEASSAETTSDTIKVAVSLPPAENAWQADFAAKLTEKLNAEASIDATIKSSTDAADQMNVIQTYKDDTSYQLMVVLPVDGLQLTATVEEVYDSGIPVIVIDRDISSDKKTAFVAGDNYGCGKVAAEYVLDYYKDAEGPIYYVELRSYAGTEIDLQRHDGFADLIDKDDRFVKLGEADGEFNSSAGYEAMSNLLAANDHIDFVYTHDDETTTGALSAYEPTGRSDIQFITGTGGTVTALNEIKADNTPHKVTSAYFPADVAEVVVEGILQYAKDGKVDSSLVAESYAITKDNVDTVMDKAYE